MSKEKKQLNKTLQDTVLDFSQIKYKHSEVFNNVNQFNYRFKNFSVYPQVPIYQYEDKDQQQEIYLRYL